MSQQQIIAKCKEVFARAQELYGVDLSTVTINFNLKGGVAGYAVPRGYRGAAHHGLRFNYDMVTRGCADTLKAMIDDVVPHEIAHIVCVARPELGRKHDAGWARVCRVLGGNGKRTHSEKVVYGKGRTFEYTTDRGHQVRLNERHHAAVQAGRTLRFRAGKGAVSKLSQFSIVGYQGRTLQQPVQPKPVNHPANIEDSLRATTLTKEVPVQQIIPPAVQRIVPPVPRVFAAGESKAATSRRIMLSGYQARHSYEAIISAMMLACGYNRQLARGTFKANAARVGIPSNFGG